MSIIARFSIPADQFAFADVLEVRRGVQIRLESMIPTGDAVVPYFWVQSEDADAVEDALRESTLVNNVRAVDETESETLFRVEWSLEINGLIDIVDDSEAVILEAEGLGDVWSFRMRFPEQENLSEFYETCVAHGITPELEEINNLLGTPSNEFGVTDAQREALLVALEAGYFEVPRRVTLVELAGQFDISDTALSQRIRRGLTTLISATMLQQSAGDEASDD